jgi:hypothetical protein
MHENMEWNKSTTTVVVFTGVLLTIGAMLVAAPSVYAESTCVGACKTRGDTDIDNSQDNSVDSHDTTTVDSHDTNTVDNSVDNSQSTTNNVENNIDNSVCKSATTVTAPNTCRIA